MDTETLARTKERGVILIMALFIITLFTVLVLEFNYSTRVEYHIAATCRDDLLALNIARAGISETVALYRDDRLLEIEEKEKEDEGGTEGGAAPTSFTQQVLQSKPQPKGAPRDIPFPDHYGEDWARERFQEPFGNGLLTLKVIDETGKININTLVKKQKEVKGQTPTPTPCVDCPKTEATETPKPPPRKWGQVDVDRTGEEETEKGKSGEEPEEPEPVRYVVDKKVEKDIMRLVKALKIRSADEEKVTGAIVDWMDSNDEGDWEDDAHGAGDAGSPVKNAPLDVLSELLLVKGVTGDLFFGPGRPETVDLDEELSRKAKKRGGTGLRDCLTVFTRGKVNVNTAPPEVLTALLEEENESLVKEIVTYTRNDYFKDLTQFEEKMGEHVPASFKARIGVGSDCVQVVSRGQVNDSVKQLRAFVYRDDEAVTRVLYWRVEK